MNDEQQSDQDPKTLGNTIDGSRTGDGAGLRSGDWEAEKPAESSLDAGDRERLEQEADVYSTPDPDEDRAVGGSIGTTDGQ